MNSGFWLGLILGVPLAIVANVLTRPVESGIGSRIRARAFRRARNTKRDYEEARRCRENREEFYEALLKSLIRIDLYIAVLIVIVVPSLMVLSQEGRIFTFDASSRLVLFFAMLILTIGAGLEILKLSAHALDLIDRVRKFSEYESEVKPMLDSEDTDS
jgi:hypothetical protein